MGGPPVRVASVHDVPSDVPWEHGDDRAWDGQMRMVEGFRGPALDSPEIGGWWGGVGLSVGHDCSWVLAGAAGTLA